jgi:hypothetical protein
MSGEQNENRDSSAALGLWTRAPGFRRITYLAAASSLIAGWAFVFNQSVAVPEAAKSAAPSVQVEPAVKATQANPHAPGMQPQTRPDPAPQPVVAAQAKDEDEILARCHPHLIPVRNPVPQIDVSGIQDPSLGHLKVHFWVNGAGVVTREALTGATYSTVQEQQAELAFTKGLTFTVPQTAECRVREIEVIGDYYEMKEEGGKWGTIVKMYPRLSFSPDGALQMRD